jgi:hypothetical protein
MSNYVASTLASDVEIDLATLATLARCLALGKLSLSSLHSIIKLVSLNSTGEGVGVSPNRCGG